MTALKLKLTLLLLLNVVPAAALDSEQTRILDQYLAQKGILNAAPAAVNIDLSGRTHALDLQLERTASIVTANTAFIVQSLGQLSQIEIKLQKPVPLIYDDARVRREIREQAVSDCCTLRKAGNSN